MKVLLISSNLDLNPHPILPVALSVLYACVEKAGYEVDVLDLLFENDFKEALKNKLEVFKPDLVGISVKSIEFDTCKAGISHIELLKIIKNDIESFNSNITILLGGAGFSSAPEYFLESTGMNYGIIGDGEEAIVDFIDAISKGLIPENVEISGLVWKKKNDEYAKKNQKVIKNLNESPIPVRNIYDKKYFEKKQVIPTNGIQTKRGCSKQCIMCNIGLSEGKIERTIDPDIIINQIKQDEFYGFNGFYIADTIFNRPLKHAHSICDALIKNKIKGPWSTAVEPGDLDIGLLQKMKDTGCRFLTIGADAIDETMIKNLKKGFTSTDVINAVENCKKIGIIHVLSLWFGGPGETMETIENSFDIVDQIKPDILLVYYGMQAYIGTYLAQLALNKNMIENEMELLNKTVLFEAEGVTKEDFMKFYKNRYKNFSRITVKSGERVAFSMNPERANDIAPLVFGQAN